MPAQQHRLIPYPLACDNTALSAPTQNLPPPSIAAASTIVLRIVVFFIFLISCFKVRGCKITQIRRTRGSKRVHDSVKSFKSHYSNLLLGRLEEKYYLCSVDGTTMKRQLTYILLIFLSVTALADGRLLQILLRCGTQQVRARGTVAAHPI